MRGIRNTRNLQRYVLTQKRSCSGRSHILIPECAFTDELIFYYYYYLFFTSISITFLYSLAVTAIQRDGSPDSIYADITEKCFPSVNPDCSRIVQPFSSHLFSVNLCPPPFVQWTIIFRITKKTAKRKNPPPNSIFLNRKVGRNGVYLFPFHFQIFFSPFEKMSLVFDTSCRSLDGRANGQQRFIAT